MEKNVKVDEEVWKTLQKEKTDENYSKISELIEDKINFTKKFKNEKEFFNWFEENYRLLGFSRIIQKRTARFPDFRMEMDGKEVKVELETLSGNFIRHRHNPAKVDIVVCLLNNKKLPVKTIEIPSFELIQDRIKQGVYIAIDPALVRKLKIYCIENNLLQSEWLEAQIVKLRIRGEAEGKEYE